MNTHNFGQVGVGNNSASMTSATVNIDTRSPIATAIENLSAEISYFGSILETLENKIHPILNVNLVCEKEKQEIASADSSSDLTRTLNHMNNDFNKLNQRLSALIKMIEL